MRVMVETSDPDSHCSRYDQITRYNVITHRSESSFTVDVLIQKKTMPSDLTGGVVVSLSKLICLPQTIMLLGRETRMERTAEYVLNRHASPR